MIRLNRFFNNDGFTIIELLMAIVILGVVMAAITTMIVQSFNVFDSSTRRMSAGQLAELGLSEVGRYLRSANSSPTHDEEYNIYSFEGFVDGEGQTIEINYSNNRITINDQVILNNVTNFEIDLDDDEFVIRIRVEDDENIAIKQTRVNSRNL